MNVIQVTISPISAFGTLLRGDTLFGQLCWQIAYDPGLFGKDLDTLLSDYNTRPFMVVSSAWFRIDQGKERSYILKRPDLPLEMLARELPGEKVDFAASRKALKRKKWVLVSEKNPLNISRSGNLLSDSEFQELLFKTTSPEVQSQLRRGENNRPVSDFSHWHNTIKRTTGTTGTGEFAPFVKEERFFYPGTRLTIFVGLREDVAEAGLKEAFERLGSTGFGRDASAGLGKFKVLETGPVNLRSLGSENPDSVFTLGPSLPGATSPGKGFFMPFVRFGRHGDRLAVSPMVFKNPVVYADEGAVFPLPRAGEEPPVYIGSAITGVSRAMPKTVSQGYSPCIPFNLGGQNA